MRSLALTSSTVAVLVAIWVMVLFASFLGLQGLRSQRAAREAQAGPPAPTGPPPVSRRDFFRRSLLVSLAVFFAQFGGASLAFLWPNLKGGFGARINAGSLAEIKAAILDQRSPFYVGAARTWIVAWDGKANPDADYRALGVTTDGIMPLYQKCVHLGCRVPFCSVSQWFECPCHGSKYNAAGEYKLGPAPRGMDRWAVSIEDGNVIVDTSLPLLGPPRGTDTIDEPPQGPFCVATG